MNNIEEPAELLPGIMLYEFRGSAIFALKLCCGLLALFGFWLVLLLRVYLPESYWTWSYLW